MSRFVPLPGSKRQPLAGSRPAGPVDKSETVSITVRVRSAGDPSELAKRVETESRKPLAERQYLSRQELATQFGAKSSDLDQVEQYAAQHNLRVVSRSAARRSIALRGALGDVLRAFPADVQLYHHSVGTYRGRTGEILIPAELQGVITGIFGFDTRPKKRITHRKRVSAMDGPGGENGESPAFFAKRYNFPQASGNVTLDGTGQGIAIIELGGGFQVSDLQTYFSEIGSPLPTVSSVSVDGADNQPGQDADGEVMLDIEVAGTVAPKANLVVYFAPNQGDKGFLDAISTAIHDTERKIDVISISWGSPEPDLSEAGATQELQAYSELFTAAAAAGVSVCVASGDHGTATSAAQDWDGKIHVSHPASDPLVLACGGTQIDNNNNDVVWNDGTPFDTSVAGGGGWASVGGISKCFPVPSYQAGIQLPAAVDGGPVGRGVPDIAMSATDYFVRVDSGEGASGGTSAVAPLMAGLIALLNQAKGKDVGFLNPFLYANANAGAVHDVTVGTNAITNTTQGYDAGPGWDACTGLGTPDGVGILNLL